VIVNPTGSIQDTTAPELVAAVRRSASTIDLIFDEALDPATLDPFSDCIPYITDSSPTRYLVSLGATIKTGAPSVIELATSAKADEDVSVDVSGIADSAGNFITVSTASAPHQSEGPTVLITEIMVDPDAQQDADGEWFEIKNVSSSALDLSGWWFSDPDTSEVLVLPEYPQVIKPGEYKLIVRNAGPGGMLDTSVAVFHEYPLMDLDNVADGLRVFSADSTMVDQVTFDTQGSWSSVSGTSYQWPPWGGDRSDGSNWFQVAPEYFSGDYGTPGRIHSIATPAPPILSHEIALSAYPNPFNPRLTIQFAVPVSTEGTLRIYNTRGARVRTLHDGQMSEGVGRAIWDGTDDAGQQISSGVYFVQLRTRAEQSQVVRVVLVR